MELTEFLLARLDEDEEAARAAAAVSIEITASGRDLEQAQFNAHQDHVARWDPARVLAESEAKRRIVAMAQQFNAMPDDCGTEVILDDVLRLLALPYADHPDYDEAWRP